MSNFQLTEFAVEKAKKELNENPKETEGALKTFREWVLQQPHLTCDVDDRYLIQFLRNAKFSQLVAREKLQSWLSNLTDVAPQWLADVDLSLPNIRNVFTSGYISILPGQTENGCKVLFASVGKIDLSGKLYQKSDLMKAVLCVNSVLLQDPNVQVHGVEFVMDLTGFSMKHQTYFGLDDVKKSTKIWQTAFPVRLKALHYYNMNPIFEAFLQFFLPLLKPKIRNRICMHGSSMESVYKKIPMRILPDEFLPDDYDGPSAGSFQSIVDETAKFMLSKENVEYIKHVRSSKHFSFDASKKPTDVPVASFRKLNVD